jgi:hypothetical protein
VKKLMLVTAAFAAAVAVFVVLTIQPRRLTLPPAADGTIPGVIHIHTNRSDGLSGPDEIAAAAARVGLKFIVFTDHGDATRRPDAPVYRSGVLCLDGVEISTTGGHYIALDMPASPYPLGGEPRDVVEDVQRLGGFGIVAHPDSPKTELRWRDWAAPFDGIELVNPDSSWRVWAQQSGWRPKLKLFAALVDYPFRSPETIAGLLHEPQELPMQWAGVTQRRKLVSMAGADAHAKLALRNADPGDSGFALPLPGYESSLRVLSVHVRPERAFTGNAADDAGVLIRAIRAGHAYTAIDGVATPASLEVTASNASATVTAGDELAAGSPVTLRVRTNAPASFTTSVWDGTKLVSGDHHEPEFSLTLPATPAVYWVSIRSTGRRPEIAWATSNPIYVRGPEPAVRPAPPAAARTTQAIFDGSSVSAWRVEHDSTSLAAVDLAPIFGGAELRFRFGLSGQITPPPFAALVFDTPGGLAASNRLAFAIRAEHPMRVSVQLRTGREGGEGERWERSVYVNTTLEDRIISFDDVSPLGATKTPKPPLDLVRSLMFVVDPINTKRETSARIWLKNVRFELSAASQTPPR